MAAWLHGRGERIVGLVVHRQDKRKYTQEIMECLALEEECIFEGHQLESDHCVKRIESLDANICLSILFGHILKPEFIVLFPKGVINLHPSYLPYNRGSYPNVWSIVEGTPAGVTLHYIDEGIDTGDVIAQKKVPIEPTDTGESLYHRLEKACVGLFKATWPALREGRVSSVRQPQGTGTYHRARDVQNIDEIDLNRTYLAKDLINIIRARTYSPYNGAYFRDPKNRRVFLRLSLYYEEQFQDG